VLDIDHGVPGAAQVLRRQQRPQVEGLGQPRLTVAEHGARRPVGQRVLTGVGELPGLVELGRGIQGIKRLGGALTLRFGL
jgi:hypothetical protein